MNGMLLSSFAFSLVLTLALEAGFFLLVGKRDPKDLLLVLLVNVLTNPAVVLLYWLAVLSASSYIAIIVAILEILAVLTEGYCYRKFGHDFQRPYLFSLSANLFSFGVGMLIQL